MKFMIEQRMLKEQDVFLKHKLPAILIFKMLCHHLHVVQHHWKPRGAKFKAVTLCFWALLVLDGIDAEGKHVGDFILALCHMFLTFEWRRFKVVVSAAGQISVAEKGTSQVPSASCWMTAWSIQRRMSHCITLKCRSNPSGGPSCIWIRSSSRRWQPRR